MILRTLLVSSLLLTALAAQERTKTPRPIGAAGGVTDAGEKIPRIGGDDVKAGKAEIDPNARRRGTMFCQFRVDARPAKLMPGQSGTILVTALLKDRAVLPASSPVQVVSPTEQGVLTLGTPVFYPASPGTLAKGFLGQPVYDNYAIFEMPVTLSPAARLGDKLTVNLQFEYELFDGDTTQSIGRYMDRASGVLEVGESLDPAVRGGYTPPVKDPESGSEVAPAPTASEADQGASAGAGAGAVGGAAAPAAVAVPEPASDGASMPDPASDGPELAEEEGVPWLLILGGGGLVLALLLLVLKRR